MSDTSLLAERSRTDPEPANEAVPSAFEQLRQLVRNGYFPDVDSAAGGAILLRHGQAPDLLLHPDGRIELPARQTPKPVQNAGPQPGSRRMSKRRTLAIVVLAAIFWVFSVFFTAVIFEM